MDKNKMSLCSFLLVTLQNLWEGLVRLDEALFFIINGHHHPLSDYVAYCITHTTFWVPLYVLWLWHIIKKFKRKSWIIFLFITLLIIICDQFASALVKPLVQRLRPCSNLALVGRLHVVGPYHGLYGFISSHATNTFGLAVFWSFLARPTLCYKLLLFFWATAISYARIYGGVHYPSDVVVGAMIGVAWGSILYKVYKRYDT